MMSVSKKRVALICMPFRLLQMPSVALAILAAALRRRGHTVDVFHFNLEATRLIELEVYGVIATHLGNDALVGEWLFSHRSITPGAGEAADISRLVGSDQEYQHDDREALTSVDLGRLKERVNTLLDGWRASHDWGRYDLVGFTVAFQQLNASLRLGKMIKERWPDVRVVLGGPSLEMPMGATVAERYPWLNAVFSGYAEVALADFLEMDPVASPRVVVCDAIGPNLDASPMPSYDGYFSKLAAMGLAGRLLVNTPIETSRGCWWGEKKRCTFCGLNADDMAFRHKSPERIVEEVRRLSAYGRSLTAVDTIIPLNMFDEVFPRLERAGLGFGGTGCYETKANLTPTHLKAFRRVGVRIIQPGVESLSTPVLRAMHKGVTAVQNLWLVRAGEEHGLRVAWNFLYGFPNEDPADYQAMANLLVRVSHLLPPRCARFIRLDRFSPLFEQSEEFGLANVRPSQASRLAFGDHPRLWDQTPFFDFEYADGRQPRVYARPVVDGVARWRRAHRGLLRPRCRAVPMGGRYLLVDSRDREEVGATRPRVRWLDRHEKRLLELLEVPRRRSALEGLWAAGPPLSPLLERLEQERLILHLDGRWLRLVVIRDPEYGATEIGKRVTAGLRRRLGRLLALGSRGLRRLRE